MRTTTFDGLRQAPKKQCCTEGAVREILKRYDPKDSGRQKMKGIYVLLIEVRRNLVLDIGALGPTAYGRGTYAYVGSAQISLKKRLERHLRKSKRKFWHVDYLVADDAVKVVKILWMEGERRQECETARRIGQLGTAVRGFGSSDCNCRSHLFKVATPDFLRQDMHEIRIEAI